MNTPLGRYRQGARLARRGRLGHDGAPMDHARRAPVAILCASVLLLCRPVSAEPTAAGSGHDATSHQSFADLEHWKSVFDDPARDAWQRPADVVRALRVRPGMTVADLGAGTGYFSRYLSEAVGAEGNVLAVEPEPKLLSYLRERAEREKTANVVPILGSLDNPRLPPASTDVVVVVDTFHHIDDRIAYFRALRHVLRRGGRVAIVDWHKRPLPVGPPPEHKLARERVVEEMRAAGYVLTEEPDVLPYQYFLVFTPS